MVTVEEIRARVEEADKARIAQRADAAARVAESVRRRAELAAALAEQDAVVTGALADAHALLTDEELIEFTGLSPADLPARPARNGRKSGRGVRKTSPTSRPRSTSRSAAKQASESSPTAEPAAADA